MPIPLLCSLPHPNTDRRTKMCTTWTITRLVKWRIRDSISCFLACRLPSDVEAASQPTVVTRHVTFDQKNNNRVVNGVYNDRLSQPSRKGKKKKHLNNHERRDKDGVSSGKSIGEPNLPDDDYIIFCFTENGEFDIVRDGRGVSTDALTGLPRISRTVNRKLNYSEEMELANKLNIQKERSQLNQCDTDTAAIPYEEEEEKEIVDKNKQQMGMGDSFRMAGQMEDTEELPISIPKLSAESRLSSHSDSSADSFAFPAYRLGWEWIGSPVPMPKSEGMHLGKKKVRRVRLQCCRPYDT